MSCSICPAPKQEVKEYLSHNTLAADYLAGLADIASPDGDLPGYVIYDDYEVSINSADYSLILNVLSTPGGVEGIRREVSVADELRRAMSCRRSTLVLTGADSGENYLKSLYCGKWWCPRCGSRMNEGGKVEQGRIQRDRKKAVYARLQGGSAVVTPSDFRNFTAFLKGFTIVQYVLTVPEIDRFRFRSKYGLNQLFGSAKRTIEKYYPDHGSIAYMHVVGDDSTEFHPHVNVHVLVDKKERIIPPDGNDKVLDGIKETWRRALIGLGCEYRGQVDVHKSFALGADRRKVLHRIKYMCKPIPFEMLKKLQDNNDIDMLHLLIIELKGFRYIRYWGELSNTKYKQWYEKHGGKSMKEYDMEEIEKKAGERLIVETIINAPIEHVLGRFDGYERLGDDFYRIKITGGMRNGGKKTNRSNW